MDSETRIEVELDSEGGERLSVWVRATGALLCLAAGGNLSI